MKQGRNLQELTAELKRQSEAKQDYITVTSKLEVVPVDNDIMLQIPMNNQTPFRLLDRACFSIQSNTHNQLSHRLAIPKRYYDKCLENSPELLTTNINHWFQNKPEKRMIRTLDNKARAYLSDHYRSLDNYDLARAILPVLQEADTQIEIHSTEVTERCLYIKVLFPKIEGEIKKGDVVQSGIVISNSEVGLGSLKIEPLLFRLVCLDGMICAAALNKYHTGRVIDAADERAIEIFRNETLETDDNAFYLKVQDVVRSRLNDTHFQKTIERVQVAAGRVVDVEPVEIVKRLARKFGLFENEKSDILTHLIQGNDMSAWGLCNAITRASLDVESYDRATELEKFGGLVIKLAQTSAYERFAHVA